MTRSLSTVRRWGRSIAVAIPAHIARQMAWNVGDYATVTVENGAIVLRRLDVAAAMRAQSRTAGVQTEAQTA